MSLTNSSSLSANEASAMYDGIIAALKAQHFEMASSEKPSGADTRVLITLSENSDEYIWSAEIWLPGLDGADRRIAIVDAPKQSGVSPPADHISVALSRKVIWDQPIKVLDFDLLSTPGKPDTLAVLEPDRLVFYRADAGGWTFDHDMAIFHTFPWPRDVSGGIDLMNGKVTFSDARCEGDVLRLDAFSCKQTAREAHAAQNAKVIDVMLGSGTADFVQLSTVCTGTGPLFLASSDGDWTQPDSLTVYDGLSGNAPLTGRAAKIIGQPIQLSGPVLALGRTTDGKAARIVSRNLQTGFYEASIVSISCTN